MLKSLRVPAIVVAVSLTLLVGCSSSSKSASTTTTSHGGAAQGPGGNCGHGPGSACGSAPNVHLTVTPHTDLASGHKVTVKLTGFLPNAAVGIEQCVSVVRSNNDCDTSSAVTGHTDASGAYTGSLTVINPIKTTGQGTVTCNSSGNCSIGASNFAAPNALPSANQDIGFSS